MKTKYTVTNRQTGEELTDEQILAEANRDRSAEWQDYTLEDLKESPAEVTDWIDIDYYEIEIIEPITKAQFLAYFESDAFHEELTDDECQKIFLQSLRGASDITAELLEQLCNDYCTSLDDVLNKVDEITLQQLKEQYGATHYKLFDAEGIPPMGYKQMVKQNETHWFYFSPTIKEWSFSRLDAEGIAKLKVIGE